MQLDISIIPVFELNVTIVYFGNAHESDSSTLIPTRDLSEIIFDRM